jgi:hypothetical protein
MCNSMQMRAPTSINNVFDDGERVRRELVHRCLSLDTSGDFCAISKDMGFRFVRITDERHHMRLICGYQYGSYNSLKICMRNEEFGCVVADAGAMQSHQMASHVTDILPPFQCKKDHP